LPLACKKIALPKPNENEEVLSRSCGKVLEIGYGSGFQTALLAQIYDEVYAIEYLPEVAELGKRNLEKIAKHLRPEYAAKIRDIHLRQGDGYEGWGADMRFDAIIVSAGGLFVPEPLKMQLKEDGGTLIGPFGPLNDQKLLKIVRTNENTFHTTELFRVRFVPFVSTHFL
jgi:protein-L-isoaspartate(D-aspartate) O-methyltransferase